jgi:hypothetical protein
MSLEKLIQCPCRHTVDLHSESGCAASMGGSNRRRCACSLRPRDVVDSVVSIEFEATRLRWLGTAGEPAAGSEG